MFKYIPSQAPKIPARYLGFHLASRDEVEQINKFAGYLKNMTKFYKEHLAQGKVDYLFSTANSINILPVKFGIENFAHLTGITFLNSNAKKQFEFLGSVSNTQPILIKNDRSTFEKLKVLPSLRLLTDVKNFKVLNIENTKAMKTIKATKGLIPKQECALIALQNFQPTYYQPKSLLNLSQETDRHKFDGIPRNTVLGIFRETNINHEMQMNYISLNQKALGNVSTLLGVVSIMGQYAKQQNKKQTIDLTKPDKSKKVVDKIAEQQAYEAELRRRGGLER